MVQSVRGSAPDYTVLVREDRPQDAARIFDARHSHVIWHVRHGLDQHLPSMHLPGQNLIVLSSAFSSHRRPNVCGTLPTLRQCPCIVCPTASLPAPKAVQFSAQGRETGRETAILVEVFFFLNCNARIGPNVVSIGWNALYNNSRTLT